MKIAELKENEPLEMQEVSKHYDGVKLDQIRTKVFTDGKVAKVGEENIQKIDKYYIGDKEYRYGVDTLNTKKVYFKDYSYIITYTIAREFTHVGNVMGWFDVVKDVSLHVKDVKDKVALKNAKNALKKIKKYNNSTDYSSIFGMLAPQNASNFVPQKIDEDIYNFKKTK